MANRAGDRDGIEPGLRQLLGPFALVDPVVGQAEPRDETRIEAVLGARLEHRGAEAADHRVVLDRHDGNAAEQQRLQQFDVDRLREAGIVDIDSILAVEDPHGLGRFDRHDAEAEHRQIGAVVADERGDLPSTKGGHDSPRKRSLTLSRG